MPLNRRQIIELSAAIKDRRDQLIEEIRGDAAKARERLAAGTYGVCVSCGADIDFSRLRARPGAARCLDCQERFENTHAPPGGATL